MLQVTLGALVLLLHATAVLVAFRAIKTSRTPQGSVGWAIFLVTFPYAALPLFLFLGHSRFPGYITERRVSRETVSHIAEINDGMHGPDSESHLRGFERMSGMPIVTGNAATLLIDGDETFDAILDAIDRAEHYVLVQFYIYRDDRLGRELQARLMAAAARGCRVRLLYDSIGSYSLPATWLEDLVAAGVACANFHSEHRPHSRFQVNFRNHRKIVIVDGEEGYLGGLNVGDEYMGRSPRFGHWRDTHLRLRGPAVAQLQLVFVEDWKWATNESLQLDWRPSRQPESYEAVIVAPGPADEHETGSLYFCNAIGAARRRLWIASPYFVPDTDIQTALALAAMRGVDVRILVSGMRDHWFVWLAAFAYFDDMRRAGVQILRYRKGFMHQKVVLVDDAFASVGTLNLDNRSCRLNFEVTAVIFDAGFARDVEAMLEADFSDSEEHTLRLEESPSRLKRFGAPVARLLAPLL